MIEIDILPASTEKKGGDCALIRIGTFDYETKRNNQIVLMIDAGYTENATRISEYLTDYYNTDIIDIALITHPDMDHISGFKKLLEGKSIKVRQTYIHDPWTHAGRIFNRTQDGRRTVNSIKNDFEDTLKMLSSVLDSVGDKNSEPFPQQLPGINAYILGPTKNYYRDTLYRFPEMEGGEQGVPSDIYSEGLSDYDPKIEHFLDDPQTSPKNNSSAITLIHDKNDTPICLFTGDAGVEAINLALNLADENNLAYKNVRLLQIPHHGSLKNISAELIDRISPAKAYVSAPPDEVKHPSRLILNYFNKKGIPVFHIKDKKGVVFYFDGALGRPGWQTAAKVEPFAKVFRLKQTFKNFLRSNT